MQQSEDKIQVNTPNPRKLFPLDPAIAGNVAQNFRHTSWTYSWRPGMALAHMCLSVFLVGCQRSHRVPETPMPPNTVLLSQALRELSAKPGFSDALLQRLGYRGSKQGPALLTPRLAVLLREQLLGKDWQGLDRFPSWDTRQLADSVGVVDSYARHTQRSNAEASAPVTVGKYLDIGPYRLDRPQVISLDAASGFPPLDASHLFSNIVGGLFIGAGPNDLAKEHAESERLADTLNRLAANSLNGTALSLATVHGHTAATPEALLQALQTAGEDVVIDDTRYFANFGHLVYNGQDVMAPFWLDTHLPVPHTAGLFRHGRSLLVPVSHAELELHLRPRDKAHGIRADVSYYFGIDGKSEWRTMDTVDQAWVLGRNAHEYRGAQAYQAMRLTTLLTLTYMHQHLRRPDLPFGGYYALGVCQDGVAVVERKLTGNVTLFPDTDDASLFDDPRDTEINTIIHTIPKDRAGRAPEPARVFGALPTTDFRKITIPGLSADLVKVYSAWKEEQSNGKHTR